MDPQNRTITSVEALLCPNCGFNLVGTGLSSFTPWVGHGWSMVPWQELLPGWYARTQSPGGTWLVTTAGQEPAPAGGEQPVARAVHEAIQLDPLVPAESSISVTVDHGTVVLSGEVPSKRAKQAAGDDAWWAARGMPVDNRLRVVGRGVRKAVEPAHPEKLAPTEVTGAPRAAGESSRTHGVRRR